MLTCNLPAGRRARAGRPRQRGVTLFDSLAALALLAFGLLGLTRMQGKMVSQATDVQTRATAVMLANQLVGYATVDPANRDCYTLPASGSCTNTAARAATNGWKTSALATLPAASAATATLVDSDNRLQVRLTWTSHADREDRSITVTTDVRDAP